MHIHGVAKVGRPSTFAQSTADIICRRLALGESLRSICADKAAGMPEITTVYDWRARNPQFDQQYARCRSDQADTIFEKIEDIAEEEPERDEFGKIDHGWVAKQRLRIDVLKWRAGKLRPKLYGEKIQQEHTGADGGPIVVSTGVPRPPAKP